MLKRFVFTLTLVALLLQIFSKGIILLSFEANRDFIAKNLCVQKETKNNCCKGSCQLKKQLNEDEKKERTSPVQSLKEISDVLFCNNTQVFFFEQSGYSITLLFPYFFPVSSTDKSVLYPPPQA